MFPSRLDLTAMTARSLLLGLALLVGGGSSALAAAAEPAPVPSRSSVPALADTAYVHTVERWRAEREERLKADGGWLTVAGLFWLKEGSNRFGTDRTNDVVLPEGSAQPRGGYFDLADGKVKLKVFPDETVKLGDQAVTERALQDDSEGAPDVLHLGRLTMQVIKRQDRFGIRLKDRDSVFRRDFSGLRWYPIDPRFRITARFVPYDPPKMISIANMIGQVSEEPCPGRVEFELDGQSVTLEPTGDPSEGLSFILSDGTTAETTYGGGRFLDTDPPKDGVVILDFNQAYNPPCAFTPYATCPLPPEQNRMKVRITAGELNYGEHK